MAAINPHDLIDLLGHLALLIASVSTLVVTYQRLHRHDDKDDK